MKNIIYIILIGSVIVGCAQREVVHTAVDSATYPPAAEKLKTNSCDKKNEVQKIDVDGKASFTLEYTTSTEEGVDGPECIISGSELFYTDKDHTKIMDFSPQAQLTTNRDFIIDIGGKAGTCGTLLDGNISVYDLKRNELLLSETLERIPGKAGSLAAALNEAGIFGVNGGYSPYESIKVSEPSGAFRNFIVSVVAIASSEGSEGTLATADVSVECRQSQTDCKFKLLNQSEKKQNLNFESCD
jgi:hypothetical protein